MVGWACQESRVVIERVGRCLLWMGAVLVAMSAAGSHTQAAPIRSLQAAYSQARALDRYEPYYLRALQQRTLKVEVPVVLRSLRPYSNGMLPDSAFVDYLRWRRSLNPTRFDYYHPTTGYMLVRDEVIRASTPLTPLVPPRVVRPSVVRPQVTNPPTVPEPSTLVIAVVLVGATWCGKCWRRNHEQARSKRG